MPMVTIPPRPTAACPPIENLAKGIPDAYPTYDLNIRTNGLNEADEMNLYRPNALMDSPVRPHRPRMALPASRTSTALRCRAGWPSLAPVSFTNTIDGQRRRRLFALDSWEIEQLCLGQRQPAAMPSRTTATRDCHRRLHQRERSPSANAEFPSSRTANPRLSPPRRWPIATRRSTSITRCRSPTTPTSRSGRSGSATRTSCSRPCCRPWPSILRKSWPSSASS